MDFCSEWNFGELNACTYMVFCSTVFLLASILSVIHILKFSFSPAVEYRSGYLPFLYHLCILLNIFIILLPPIYIFTNLNEELSANSIIFSSVHGTYWSLSLVLRIIARNFRETPLIIIFNDFVAIFISVVIPLFCFRQLFHARSYLEFSQTKIVFYCLEAFSILFIYFSTIIKQTLRIQIHSQSTWSKLSKKISMVTPYIWPKKNIYLQIRVILCLFLLVIGRFINVSLPLYNKWIVNGLTHPDPSIYKLIIISFFLKFLQGSGAMGGFILSLRSLLWIPIQQYTTYEIQVELFEHLHSLSLRWHLSRKTGQVIRIMDRGTSSIDSILNYTLFSVLPTFADILIAIIFFFTTFSVYFGLLIFVTMILYLVITIFISEWRTKFRRDMNEKENFSHAVGVDSLLNYETVKYCNAEQAECDRFSHSIKNFQNIEWKTSASLSLLNFCQNSVIGIGLIIGSILIAYFILNDGSTLTAGDYVLFTTYMLQLYVPLNFFGTIYRVIQQAFIDMENMLDLLSEDVEIVDKENALPLEPGNGSIIFKNVYFEYSPEKVVLRDVSFAVNRGQTIALVGPSGGGKSTIIRLLFRLFDVTDGQILFGGQDIRDIKLNSLRKHIGIVPQDTVLFNENIKFNIRYGDLHASDLEVVDAARAAEIHDKILSFPDGYNTIVGERGLKLSGGEKQRISIARMVLKKPQYILLDEATSALDTTTERSILKCLSNLSRGRTTIIVAHRLSTIVNADQIYVLDEGRIIENGTHIELLNKKGWYYDMWDAQSEEPK